MIERAEICKKITFIANLNTNELFATFLEKINNEWYLVRVISIGNMAKREEIKIPKELGERLYKMLLNEEINNKNAGT